jgi:hypothetical protein
MQAILPRRQFACASSGINPVLNRVVLPMPTRFKWPNLDRKWFEAVANQRATYR